MTMTMQKQQTVQWTLCSLSDVDKDDDVDGDNRLDNDDDDDAAEATDGGH